MWAAFSSAQLHFQLFTFLLSGVEILLSAGPLGAHGDHTHLQLLSPQECVSHVAVL